MIVEMLDGMVSGTMGQAAPKFFNYIGTIFIFILVSNISGLLGLRPPTADYGVTLPLALLTFSLIHINKWKYQKPMTIWTDLCSPLPPWLVSGNGKGHQQEHHDQDAYVRCGNPNGMPEKGILKHPMDIEIKTKKGVTRDKQDRFHNELRKLGHLVFVVRSAEQAVHIYNTYVGQTT